MKSVCISDKMKCYDIMIKKKSSMISWIQISEHIRQLLNDSQIISQQKTNYHGEKIDETFSSPNIPFEIIYEKKTVNHVINYLAIINLDLPGIFFYWFTWKFSYNYKNLQNNEY